MCCVSILYAGVMNTNPGSICDDIVMPVHEVLKKLCTGANMRRDYQNYLLIPYMNEWSLLHSILKRIDWLSDASLSHAHSLCMYGSWSSSTAVSIVPCPS